MPRGKQQSDEERERKHTDNAQTHGRCCGSIEIDGCVVVFLNLLSFAAGVAMAGVGGLLIYNAIEKGAQMSVDRWIVTIYSVLMGILVIASSGRFVGATAPAPFAVRSATDTGDADSRSDCLSPLCPSVSSFACVALC